LLLNGGIPCATVIVAAQGLQEYSITGVEISDGKLTTLVATMQPAAALRASLEGIAPNTRVDQITARMEDEQGKVVIGIFPDEILFVNRGRAGATVTLLNLSPHTRQVRLIVPGHQDVIIKIKPAPGEVVETKVSAIRR
jgi:hypothetical protein